MFDLYLSYPMTHIGQLDLDARDQLRNACERRLLNVYDPATMEPGGKSIAAYRSYDFLRQAECRGMIVCWSNLAHLSKGVAAEIEWAATRLQRQPIFPNGLDFRYGFYVWQPELISSPPIHPWTRAAMAVAFNRWGGGILTGERGLRKILASVQARQING